MAHSAHDQQMETDNYSTVLESCACVCKWLVGMQMVQPPINFAILFEHVSARESIHALCMIFCLYFG